MGRHLYFRVLVDHLAPKRHWKQKKNKSRKGEQITFKISFGTQVLFWKSFLRKQETHRDATRSTITNHHREISLRHRWLLKPSSLCNYEFKLIKVLWRSYLLPLHKAYLQYFSSLLIIGCNFKRILKTKLQWANTTREESKCPSG